MKALSNPGDFEVSHCAMWRPRLRPGAVGSNGLIYGLDIWGLGELQPELGRSITGWQKTGSGEVEPWWQWKQHEERGQCIPEYLFGVVGRLRRLCSLPCELGEDTEPTAGLQCGHWLGTACVPAPPRAELCPPLETLSPAPQLCSVQNKFHSDPLQWPVSRAPARNTFNRSSSAGVHTEFPLDPGTGLTGCECCTTSSAELSPACSGAASTGGCRQYTSWHLLLPTNNQTISNVTCTMAIQMQQNKEMIQNYINKVP